MFCFVDLVFPWTVFVFIACRSVFSQKIQDVPVAEKLVGIALTPENKLRFEMAKVSFIDAEHVLMYSPRANWRKYQKTTCKIYQ